jgi:hypothetical protein
MNANNMSANSRVGLSVGDAVSCSATGCTRAEFKRNGQYLYAPVGAGATTVTCPDPATLPVGSQVVIDNSNGSGDFVLEPSVGSSIITVAATVIAIVFVAASGEFRAIVTA